MGVLDKILRAGEGKVLRKLEGMAKAVNAIEEDFVNLTDAELRALTDEYKQRYADGETDYLDGITVQYPDWWFNVRPSNTEPFLRLVLEAKTPEDLARRRAELESLLGTPVSH